jgi:two-component system, NarL family, response regulator LiaR
VRSRKLARRGLTREIKATENAPRVVILTMADADQEGLAALGAGADGYCVKTSSVQTIVDAVRTIASGGAYFDPHVAHVVLGRFTGAQRDQRATLKPRQMQILRLIAEGVPNPEIAERLHLGLGTVKGYVAEILVELSAADRTQAAVTAFRRGILF